MGMGPKKQGNTTAVTENPLDGEELLLEKIFGSAGEQGTKQEMLNSVVTEKALLPEPSQSRTVRRQPTKPSHYKIVSISLYNEDIDHLENMVRELKRRGHYKANKSQLIRYALANLELDAIPREF